MQGNNERNKRIQNKDRRLMRNQLYMLGKSFLEDRLWYRN